MLGHPCCTLEKCFKTLEFHCILHWVLPVINLFFEILNNPTLDNANEYVHLVHIHTSQSLHVCKELLSYQKIIKILALWKDH